MKNCWRIPLAGAVALALAGLGGAADQSALEAWRVLHLAIDSGGPSAEEVFVVLGAINDAESRKLLEKVLKSESGWAGPAARGLDTAQCVLYLPLLKRVALSPSFREKLPVLSAIAKVGTAEAAEVLREVADAGVQPAMGVAFGFLESMDAAAAPALENEIISGSAPVQRVTAAYALGRMRSPGAVPAFRAALHDPDPRVRLAGALGLGRLGSVDGEAELEAAAEGSNLDDRIEAVVTLAALGVPGSVARLKGLLANPDQAARLRTVWAIARIGGPELKDFCYAQGLQKRPEFRSMLAEKLLDPSDARDLLLLSEMLGDQDEVSRLVAAGRLLNVVRLSGEARAVIAGGLGSKSGVARGVALNLASKNEPLKATLAGFIGSGDILVREAAIAAAGNLRQREQFARIASYLQDPAPPVSLAAAKALAAIDAQAARPILTHGLTSDVSYVRIHSAALLLRTGGATGQVIRVVP